MRVTITNDQAQRLREVAAQIDLADNIRPLMGYRKQVQDLHKGIDPTGGMVSVDAQIEAIKNATR